MIVAVLLIQRTNSSLGSKPPCSARNAQHSDRKPLTLAYKVPQCTHKRRHFAIQQSGSARKQTNLASKAFRWPRNAAHSAAKPNCLKCHASNLASLPANFVPRLRPIAQEAESPAGASLHRDARPPREPDGLPFRSHQECIAHVPSLV